MRQLIYRSATLLVLLAASGLTLGLLGDLHGWLDLWSHLRWQYAAVFGLGCLLYGVMRRPLEALLTLAAFAYCLGSIWPGVGTASTGQAALSVLSVNLWQGNRDHQRLLELIRRERPDVLVLIELTDYQLAALEQLSDLYPSRLQLPAGAFGIGVWSNLPEAKLEFANLGSNDYPAITLAARWQGKPLWLIAAHPVPPLGARLRGLREQQLRALHDLVQLDPAHAVLVGDLNTTPWSTEYRGLMSTGLTAGPHWPTPTWSPGLSVGWLFAIPIDHLLTGSGWTVVGRRIGPEVGSDHRPLIVDIAASQGAAN